VSGAGRVIDGRCDMIQIELPAELEAALRKALGRDLGLEARDALLVEAYRRGAISVRQLAGALATSIHDAHQFLKDRHVPLNYSAEDLDDDLRDAPGRRSA